MIHKLNIDSEQKCKTCGKSGTLEDGFCMTHSPKAKEKMNSFVLAMLDLYTSGYVHIGPKTAARIISDVQSLMVENLHKMDVAYTQAEDGLSIAFSAKLSYPKVNEGEGVKVDTVMTFIESKVKDSRTGVINEKQKGLFKE